MTMDVTKITEGLWQWTTPTSGAGDVPVHRSTYVEAEDATVLIDPRFPDDAAERDRFWRAFDGDVARRGLPVLVLLTGGPDVAALAEIQDRHAAQASGPVGDRARGVAPAPDGTAPATGIVCRTLTAPTGDRRAMFLLPGHGAVVIGDFPDTPERRRTLVEHVVQSTVLAAQRTGGEPPPIRWLLSSVAEPDDLNVRD